MDAAPRQQLVGAAHCRVPYLLGRGEKGERMRDERRLHSLVLKAVECTRGSNGMWLSPARKGVRVCLSRITRRGQRTHHRAVLVVAAAAADGTRICGGPANHGAVLHEVCINHGNARWAAVLPRACGAQEAKRGQQGGPQHALGRDLMSGAVRSASSVKLAGWLATAQYRAQPDWRPLARHA